MRSIAPRTGAPEITIAEEQEEYMTLTAAVYQYEGGILGRLTRWTFTQEERAAIAAGEDIYIMQLGNGPFTPMAVRCGPSEFKP